MKINITLPRAGDPMTKYYVGLGTLSILVLVIVLITVLGNAALRHDYQLETTIQNMQSQIDSYISAHQQLPGVPLDAGITDSKGVDYKTIGNSRYMLCANFSTKSSDYQPPDQTFVSGVQNGAQMAGTSIATDTHFSNGDQGSTAHEKGYDCVVYSPTVLSDAYLKPYVLCQNNRYKGMIGNQLITAVDPVKQTIALSYVYNYNYQSTTPGAAGPSQVPPNYSRTYEVNKDAVFYDRYCKQISLSDVTVGERVNVYQNNTGTLLVDGLQAE